MIPIKNLQLGDWVTTGKGFPMQVVGTFKDVAYLDFEGNEGDVWEVKEKEIEPIPITGEILHNSGFRIHNITHYETESESVFFIGNKHYRVTVRPWHDGKFLHKCFYVEMCNDEYYPYFDRYFSGHIHFVHELQHAMKDCEIEKEIAL